MEIRSKTSIATLNLMPFVTVPYYYLNRLRPDVVVRLTEHVNKVVKGTIAICKAGENGKRLLEVYEIKSEEEGKNAAQRDAKGYQSILLSSGIPAVLGGDFGGAEGARVGTFSIHAFATPFGDLTWRMDGNGVILYKYSDWGGDDEEKKALKGQYDKISQQMAQAAQKWATKQVMQSDPVIQAIERGYEYGIYGQLPAIPGLPNSPYGPSPMPFLPPFQPGRDLPPLPGRSPDPYAPDQNDPEAPTAPRPQPQDFPTPIRNPDDGQQIRPYDPPPRPGRPNEGEGGEDADERDKDGVEVPIEID